MELIKHRKHPSTTGHHELSSGVKHIAWARAARWAGWGFGEALVAILIFRNSGSFLEAGLLRAVFDVALLVSIPFAGALADKLSARYLIIIALSLYPFVGLSYLFAGLFGMALFIVLARALNGFLWSLENTGAAAYYRRMAEKRAVASSLGYIDTWTHFGWLGAAFAGMAMASFVPVHWLLFLIAPVSLVALSIARGAPLDPPEKRVEAKAGASFAKAFAADWSEWRSWNGHLRLLGAVAVFTGFIEAFIWFFAPMYAYMRGADLSFVILLSAVGIVPSLMSYSLRQFTNAKDEYALVTGGLFGTALVIAGIAAFPHYAWMLAASFALGAALELFTLMQSALSSKLGSEEGREKRARAFETLATVGDISAPIVLGALLDAMNFSKVAFVVALASAILCLVYASIMRKHHAAAR